MTIECLHPHCHTELPRGRFCCGRHYYQLDEDLRKQWSKAQNADQSMLEQMRELTIEYFEARLIGDHEISRCRNCGGDIVFFLNRSGQWYPVDAKGVEPDDSRFVDGRHTFHRQTCTALNTQDVGP